VIIDRGAPPAPRSGDRVRQRVLVRGIVQGVGFRPFVWSLAGRLGLDGFVRNSSGAVIVEVEGHPSAIASFVAAVRREAPPLAQVTSVESGEVPPRRLPGFVIVDSAIVEGEHQPLSPDAATCTECLAELFDPADRRYLHPFVNCTNCGPRFTIIEDIPYDRARTTMRHFPMCPRCRLEYEDPADRRFHAQPVCCPDCGPRLWYTEAGDGGAGADPIALAATRIRAGGIVAVKGLGGFQLACDATDEAAVQRLRWRKRRPAKPLAVMVAEVSGARAICHVSAAEAAVLRSSAAPIVLLRRRSDVAGLAASVAPGLDEVGLLLPATPIHHLLVRAVGRPVVMTSGNRTEEPIARENAEAAQRLAGIADAFLLHDRDIHARYDDSVVRVASGAERLVRRARGYCPRPLLLGEGGPEVLSLGGHLKNTFCVVRDGRAFVGPHIGDLDHPLSRVHQGEALATYLRLFRSRPAVVACDLHPDYASTGLAEAWWDRGAVPVQVQHHHAHIASVMAEHGLRGRLLGVAFDGTGYGTDGSIWGGELLVCDEAGFQRAGHIGTVRQPGGDRCAREGWRMAAAYLVASGQAGRELPPGLRELGGGSRAERWHRVARLAAQAGPAAPASTSVGRLFDAVASILGVAHQSSFEAEAAMRLEAVARSVEGGCPGLFPVPWSDGSVRVLDTVGLVGALVAAARAGRPAAELAAAFHESLARGVAAWVTAVAAETGLRRVALSGGVFQNTLLLERVWALLEEWDLEVHANSQVPANDGGISLGQALVAWSSRGGGA
jgi:hydrogenase maturation protein HypF